MIICKKSIGSLRRTVSVLITCVTVLAYIQLRYMYNWPRSVRVHQRGGLNTLIPNDFREPVTDPTVEDTTITRVTVSYINRSNTGGLITQHISMNTESEVSAVNADSVNAKKGPTFRHNSLSVSNFTSNIIGDVLPLQRRNDTDANYTDIPLLLLFSSWAHTKEKAQVHAAIIRLWSAWSFIKNGVVTSDNVVKRHARLAGWYVEPQTHVHHDCSGPPVLAPMFTQMIDKYSAHYFGFSNSDILFGNGLAETLKFLYEHDSWRTKPLLIVGRRYNVDFQNNTNVALETPADVEQLTKRGTLVLRSTDFFITNKHFPWRKAPEVSIGRPYVVRAIIGFALKRKIAVIEATKTIEAVHLTTKDGILASWHVKGVKCNEKVLAKLHWRVPTKIGHCECALLETFRENDEIKVRHRKANRTICS